MHKDLRNVLFVMLLCQFPAWSNLNFPRKLYGGKIIKNFIGIRKTLPFVCEQGFELSKYEEVNLKMKSTFSIAIFVMITIMENVILEFQGEYKFFYT